MGIAAYNRGSAAISAQIDQEQAQKPKDDSTFVAWWSERAHAKQEARILALESDLSGARALILRLQVERNALRDEVTAERRRSRLVTDMFLGQQKRLRAAGTHIAWLKGLLQFCGVSSDSVRSYEECL